jgi:hypothetical protein
MDREQEKPCSGPVCNTFSKGWTNFDLKKAFDISQVMYVHIGRGRHLKRYSGILITVRYVFTFSHKALTLLRSLIASIIYRSGHISGIIASYSYYSKLTY